MPNKAPAATPIPRTGGHPAVIYRDAKGRTHSAIIIGAGSTSGLKIKLPHYKTGRIIDNVAIATTVKATGVYFRRRTQSTISGSGR